ncbi:MAG: DUF4845 domain-containing protein [Gammaproteobacteria bacterium]|nr:DUF4845 domain-containing protein [Gammaproteobacteria bacterium]
MNKLELNNLPSLQSQRGASKFGLLMLFLLISGFLTAGLKVAPLYVDHNLITGICEELVDNGEAVNMTITDVRNRVSNTLRINNVTDFDLNAITMRKENNRAIITIDYERRVELVANLDIVAKFNTVLQ